MHISTAFESGSIEVVDAYEPRRVKLKLVDDAGGYRQWFHFRAAGVHNIECHYEIADANKASFPDGWQIYQACASYDCDYWFRVPTEYDGSTLSIAHKPKADSVYYALSVPYTLERHRRFIGRCQLSSRGRTAVLGHSRDGHEIDLLTIGDDDASKLKCWIIARQHPGETFGSWLLEGLVYRLLDPDDAVVRDLLKRAVFFVVPNVNPDGSCRGFLRSNSAGVNLNREWHAPSLERSPEVLYVRDSMHRKGIDFCLDVHADASFPFVYIEGGDAAPSVTERQLLLHRRFEDCLQRVNPDYQNKRRYPFEPELGKGDLSMCVYYVAETFNALSLMLEMPFSDYDEAPDEVHGWSPVRSHNLGASCLDALFAVIDDLR